ncbi:Glu/Leu/Phe/Val dehydrogenase family protein [Agromyces sp. CFH 90414]|uniref:Glu/Leu/Phe/Val dehydrogenase family protein n=1 Tax=Agromyces agglutinans TaxID=2662258 RepID=A0A6I2F8Z2_9MICO|nr:Glu/Leu/Phe/Val dehydrogenase dimerization domain-containing protein [Agromyces agglutinans]MRG61099.1 Glu/Leu/Phe/Val dehydrogenase family protein [Agromyces agglutinans]
MSITHPTATPHTPAAQPATTVPLPLDAPGHERVLVSRGRRSGLTVVVAVHSTVLGQALGGARLWQYEHWTDALADALRLSEAMTMKNAAAGLARGGGKAVIHVPTGVEVDDALRRAAMLDLGDAVEALGGAYMTAEDVGTSAELMAVVAERTAHVCGLPPEQGGVGEPADATAAGVHAGLLATLEHVTGRREVAGRHVVIAGLGQVGGRLARQLAAEGARLTVTDVADDKRALAEELGAEWVEPAEAALVEADVFAPCGLGGVLTPEVVRRLRVRAVVGAANNQLASRDVADLLRQRGIAWAPDFVVNAGGVVYLDLASTPGVGAAERAERIAAIGDTVGRVLREADASGETTLAAAERLANARLAAARG